MQKWRDAIRRQWDPDIAPGTAGVLPSVGLPHSQLSTLAGGCPEPIALLKDQSVKQVQQLAPGPPSGPTVFPAAACGARGQATLTSPPASARCSHGRDRVVPAIWDSDEMAGVRSRVHARGLPKQG